MLPPGAMPISAQAKRACSQSMLAALEVIHDPSSAAKQQIRTIRDMLYPLGIALTSRGGGDPVVAYPSTAQEPKVRRLSAGGEWIRTTGTAAQNPVSL